MRHPRPPRDGVLHTEMRMQYIRSKAFDLFAVVWTLLFAPSWPILWMAGSPSRAIRKVARVWIGGFLLGLRYIVGLSHVERGRENIPDGPCIVAANHQSMWETLALCRLFPDAAFVAKQEISRIPVVGWHVKHYPMILIEREAGPSALRKTVAESRAALAAGRSIVIFPEGTRRRIADPVTFRRGIELLYSELQVPVLPVALNSGAFWSSDRSFKNKGVITVSYLPPIMPGLPREEFKARAESMLQAEKERLLAEVASHRRQRCSA